MFSNYLKVALRNLLRHKGYSAINIFGLAVGMAACIVILLWVRFNLSYDDFHANADRVYLLYEKQNFSWQRRIRDRIATDGGHEVRQYWMNTQR